MPALKLGQSRLWSFILVINTNLNIYTMNIFNRIRALRKQVEDLTESNKNLTIISNQLTILNQELINLNDELKTRLQVIQEENCGLCNTIDRTSDKQYHFNLNDFATFKLNHPDLFGAFGQFISHERIMVDFAEWLDKQ